MNFFAIFFLNILLRAQYERNSGLKFFSCFLGLSLPVLAKNNAGKRYLNFLTFLAFFFRNFLAQVEYEQNSGLKFFSLFVGLSHTVLAKNNAGKRFFKFFCYFFFYFSCPGQVWTEVWTKFFSRFPGIPFWLKIMPERGFLIFLFLFSEFFCRGQV